MSSKTSCQLDWLSFTLRWPHTIKKTLDKNGCELVVSTPLNRSVSGAWLGGSFMALIAQLPGELREKLNCSEFQPSDKTKLPKDIVKEAYPQRKLRNYDLQIPSEIGYVAISTKHERQGLHVQLNGQDLTMLRALNLNIEKLCMELLQLGANVTRLDLALDVKTRYKPHHLRSLAASGQLAPPKNVQRKLQTYYVENDFGDTGSGLYFGAPDSVRRVRVYDKGKQLQQSDPLLRIELKLRDEQAAEWSNFIAENSLSAACSSSLRAFFPNWLLLHHWLVELPDLAPIQVKRVDRPGSERWLRTVAVPAVLEALLRDDGYGADLRQQVVDTLSGITLKQSAASELSSKVAMLSRSDTLAKVVRQRDDYRKANNLPAPKTDRVLSDEWFKHKTIK